jgi:hypothetical protein
MSQTPRDVIDSLLRGPGARPPAERVGAWEGFWSDAILRWVQEGYPLRRVYKEVGQKHWRSSDGQSEDATVAGEYDEPVPTWQHFGHDKASAGGWFDIMPRRDYDEVLEESEEWEVHRNGAGASLKCMKARGARLVFGSDHSIPPQVRYGTYKYALQVYCDHMLY